MVDLDLKMKFGMAKVPVVYMNTALDFQVWHVSLRRMVKAYGMGDALMFSVPVNQYQAFRKRLGGADEALKKEDEAKVDAKGAVVVPIIVDLTAEPLVEEPRTAKELLMMRSMGVSRSMDEFFSTSTAFVNVRTDKGGMGRVLSARDLAVDGILVGQRYTQVGGALYLSSL